MKKVCLFLPHVGNPEDVGLLTSRLMCAAKSIAGNKGCRGKTWGCGVYAQHLILFASYSASIYVMPLASPGPGPCGPDVQSCLSTAFTGVSQMPLVSFVQALRQPSAQSSFV